MCWFKHKWGKWVQYEAPMIWVPAKGGPSYNTIDYRQQRQCERCGKVQEELIR